LGIFTFGGMLSFFPYRYVDRSKVYRISEINDDTSYIQLRGKIGSVQTFGSPRQKRVVTMLRDGSGEIELIWFQGAKWIEEKLKPGVEYMVFGKPSWFNGKLNIAHPELETPQEFYAVIGNNIRPFYSSTEKLKARGLDSRGISKLIRNLVESEKYEILENIPQEILSNLKLLNRKDSFTQIHFPSDLDILKRAQTRLKFEELFFIQLRLLKQKYIRTQKPSGHQFTTVGKFVNDFFSQNLKFEMTNAQNRVIKEIRRDMGSG